MRTPWDSLLEKYVRKNTVVTKQTKRGRLIPALLASFSSFSHPPPSSPLRPHPEHFPISFFEPFPSWSLAFSQQFSRLIDNSTPGVFFVIFRTSSFITRWSQHDYGRITQHANATINEAFWCNDRTKGSNTPSDRTQNNESITEAFMHTIIWVQID